MKLRRRDATLDMTRGSPMRLILAFGIPTLLGHLFQQCYNAVDTAVVGKVLGGPALAAVGSTGAISFLVVGFCGGPCGGLSIPAAQAFGAGDERELRRCVTTGAWLAAIMAALLTAVMVTFCRGILTAMDTPPDIYERSYRYICTIFAGLPAYFLYNYTAGVLRALGDSRTPVVCLTAASLGNIVLDLLFVLVFRMDVFGAALATVLAQLFAGLGCLFTMLRFPILKMEKGDWAWDWRRAGRLCGMGLPMGLQYSITAVGSIMLQTSINGLGTLNVTAITAANKVSFFFGCAYEALGATMATYGGQNVGARAWDRLHKGYRAGVIIGWGYAVFSFAAIYFLAEPLTKLFLDEASYPLLPLARQFLLITIGFYFALCLVNTTRFLIQGMGFASLAVVAGILEMAARWGVSYLVRAYGYTAACFASPAAWCMADLFLVPAYFYCHKKLRQAEEQSGLPQP